MSRSLSREEKERILRALEEDREFRYALMGLLGFKEILDRITKLEESQRRLEERMLRLEERQQKLEERMAKLEERVARLEERVTRLEEEMRDTRRVLMVVCHRFGILSEEAFREGMKYVVEEVLGVAKVEKRVLRDEEGIVYGYPSVVDIDVVIRDREHVVIEVKSRVSKGDVAELHRIGKLYEKVFGVKPRLLIVGGFMERGAKEVARALGVEIRPVSREFEELAT